MQIKEIAKLEKVNSDQQSLFFSQWAINNV